MKKSIILLMCSIAILVGSCKKDSSDPSNTEKITGKNWRLVAATVNPPVTINGVQITDLYAQTQACSRDNLRTLNANGTYLDDEGLTKCNVSDPQTVAGTWKFNSTETIITFDNTDSYNILQNDGNILKVAQTQVDATSGISYTTTYTFNK